VEIKRLSELHLGDSSKSGRRMNVCVVSSEFLGPVKNGGIGTATSALARQLIGDGHAVTLLYTYGGYGKPFTGDRPWQYWVDKLRADGIVLEWIPHDGDYRAWREASWLVKDFLSQRNFELVYFNDHFGSGYYSMLAKRAGLAPFREQLHCVITHGSMEWVFSLNDQYANRVTDLEWMGIERRSVELADIVIAPSKYLLRQYESYGWSLPAQSYHQPYPVFRNPTEIDYDRQIPIRELVFFGRLETRKGLWLFCEAIDHLSERMSGLSVAFLGRATEFSGISSALQVVNRSANWPFRVRLLTKLDQEQALRYLSQPGRLAVMPSLADNSPCVVYECMEAGIPFVTTLGSGADELIDPTCWNDVMVNSNVKALTDKIAAVIEKGAALAKPRFDPIENLATWSAWHRYVAENHTSLIQRSLLGRPTEIARSGQDKAGLIVVIDSGTCPLSLLLRNLNSHVKRFGMRAGYLILTSRRGELQDVLLDILESGSDPTPLCILDSRAIEEAQQLIFASTYAFFADAEAEISTPFFVSALDLLSQSQPAVITCAVAIRRDWNQTGEIEELPSGDVPGLSGLGFPIGGSVWAMSAAALANQMSFLRLYDKQLDAITPSLSMGQSMMERCRTASVPIHLLPFVGAVETRGLDAPEVLRNFNEVRASAAALGIEPTVYSGGAPWFAMSAFSARSTEPEAPIEAKFLPPEHPLNSNDWGNANPETVDLAELAAALCRPGLALQIEASKGPPLRRVRHLKELAARSMRMRPYWDLASELNDGKVIGFGKGISEISTEEGKSQRDRKLMNQGSRDRPDGDPRRIYVDARRLQIRRGKIQATGSLRTGGPGKVFFFDVPLCANSAIVARLRSSISSDPMLVRVRTFDQRYGEEMAVAAARLAPDSGVELSIPLHNIFGTATIVLELSGARTMEVTVEALWVQ
jgi:glycosyltransferase involved in cell wall biosynthesis